MREIKFRGLRTDGEWVFGYLFLTRFENFKEYGLRPVIQVINDTDDGYNGHIVLPETVGQFTGLTDKNGKEIYEGDILKWKTRRFRSCYTGLKEDRDKLQTITWKSAVEYDMNGYCITESFDVINQRNNCPLIEDKTLEVIGNIHENKELLNV